MFQKMGRLGPELGRLEHPAASVFGVRIHFLSTVQRLSNFVTVMRYEKYILWTVQKQVRQE